MNLVSVMLVRNGTVSGYTTFPDTPEGNQRAAEKLRAEIADLGYSSNENAIEDALMDGHIEFKDGHSIQIVHGDGMLTSDDAVATTTVQFGLRNRKTGELVRLKVTDASVHGFDDEDYMLSSDDWDDGFVVNDLQDLWDLLHEDPGPYNSTKRRPAWGSFTADDLEPVQLTRSCEIQPITTKPPLVVERLSTRDTPSNVASRYAGRKLPPGMYTLVATTLPDGETLESLRTRIGSPIYCGDIHHKLQLRDALPAPEDSPEGSEAEGAILLICSPLLGSA